MPDGRPAHRPRPLAVTGGSSGIGRTLDLTDNAAVADALDGLDVDVLVCNAGVVPPLGPVHETAGDEAARAIEVNLTAHVRLVHAVLPRMVARGSGHVLVTGSTAGHAPVAGMATYSATKAALGVWPRPCRAARRPGHRARRGRTETDLYRDRLDEQGRAALYDGAYVQRSRPMSPGPGQLAEAARPDDVA